MILLKLFCTLLFFVAHYLIFRFGYEAPADPIGLIKAMMLQLICIVLGASAVLTLLKDYKFKRPISVDSSR